MELKERVIAWADAAPPEVRSWLGSITVRRFLRENANLNFQQVGRYDGAMGEDCKQLCRNYQVIAEALLTPAPPPETER